MNQSKDRENLEDNEIVLTDPSPQAIGESFVESLTARNFEALEQLFLPKVHFHSLVPSAHLSGETPFETVGLLQDWFGDKDTIDIVQSGVDMIEEVLCVHYRLRVHDRFNGWQVIEQHGYAVLREGKIAEMRLACSGFQPIGKSKRPKPEDADETKENYPHRDELLEFHAQAPETGSTCASLTPAIRSKLREMQSGQVLEVRVDDPAARGDIEAWSRLSGNPLLKMVDDEGPQLRFFVQKK